jgi:DNA-binding NarL/FixJ family response regulator
MNILIIDEQAVYRLGVTQLVRQIDADARLVEAESIEGALARRLGDDADIAIVHLESRRGDVAHWIGRLRSACPTLPVVGLWSGADKSLVGDALAHGARCVIEMAAAPEVVASAIRLMLSTGVHLPIIPDTDGFPAIGPDAAVSLGVRHGPGRRTSPMDLGFTRRQSDVLFYLMQGKPSKLISRELDLSPSTVKTHIGAIMRKLNVVSRTQVVIAASNMGLKFDLAGVH